MRAEQTGTVPPVPDGHAAADGTVRPPGARPDAAARASAAGGMLALAVGAGLLGALHVLPPTSLVDPVRRTLSQYALSENGWVFDVAVLLLAAGSAAILTALVRTGLVARGSGAAAALLLWTASLVAVVVFEKHNWSVGPSLSGDIHRVAGLVAFLSLPAGALLTAARWRRDPRWGRRARWTVAGGTLCLLWFAPIAVAYLGEPWTGVPWWRAIPLGAVERGLGATELLTLVLLAAWALRAAAGTRRTPAQPPRRWTRRAEPRRR